MIIVNKGKYKGFVSDMWTLAYRVSDDGILLNKVAFIFKNGKRISLSLDGEIELEFKRPVNIFELDLHALRKNRKSNTTNIKS